ncbi:MAG: hypothetical protein K2I18_10400 [Paramuribaculum sp.]|nr:hypothetical protein [Paramuribaculum sp.]
MDYLNIAYEAWKSAARFRADRTRLKRFTYGDQWGDFVTTPSGRLISEREMATRNGATPHTNNLLRQMVKTAVGLYRRDYSVPVAEELKDVAERNSLEELDARSLEEFLISGCAVQRVVYERRPGGAGLWADIVSPERFFVNAYRDPRGCDIDTIGMLHDMRPPQVMIRFGGSDSDRRKSIWQMCTAGEDTFSPSLFEDESSVFSKAPRGMCRIIELWTMETVRVIKGYDPVEQREFMSELDQMPVIDATNSEREDDMRIVSRCVDSVRWKCRWLTTGGKVLDEYYSPFAHSSHPFAVKMYPLIDGEVHSLVEDVVDQQKYINRMISLIDKIMQSSAKGVLLFPDDRKPDNYSWDDVADLWCDCRGIIPFKSAPGSTVMPQQITTSGATADAHKLLGTQLELMEQISGVAGGLIGKGLPANASAALYETRARYSATALADIFGAFSSFVSSRNRLLMTTRL